MSRKAIQGYPEKSFFDNTRFLGVIATNDPLNEGYFKHLVNFDISDTGQSLMPRKGYLTTTLRHTTQQQEYVSLSKDTIIFKDQNIQKHILYDFMNDKGYIADVSAYNIVDKFLPLTHVILNTDWSSVCNFIYRVVPNLVNALDNAGMNTIQKTAYVLYRLSIYGDAKIAHIVDFNNIRKSILKLKFSDTTYGDYIFFLEIYYRENEVPLLSQPADTLVFSAVDTTDHPSYLSYERNIASTLSIIPERLQRLFTTVNKPDGHVNHFGLTYIEDLGNPRKYYMNHIYPNTNYTFIPHFELNPATVVTNNETGKWAWRFDVVSTKRFGITENSFKEDTVFRSNWFTYLNENHQPTIIFPRFTTHDLTNSDKELRHYKGARKVITLVPKTVNGHDTIIDENVIPPNVTITEPGSWTTFINLYNKWVLEIGKVISIKSLKTSIENLAGHALFHVADLTDPTNITGNTFGKLNNLLNDTETIPRTSAADNTYTNNFITADELIELIDDGLFKKDDIVFKYLPFVSKNTYTPYETSEIHYRWFFVSLPYWDTFTINQLLVDTKYNLYNGKSEKTFSIARTIDELDEFGFPINIRLAGCYTSTLNSIVDPEIPHMSKDGFFDNGYTIVFYIRPYTDVEITDKTITELELIKTSWDLSAYSTGGQVIYGYDDLTVRTIQEYLIKEPLDIQNSQNLIVFNDNRLVLWHNNIVYLSEPGRYYYFKEENKKEFPERVVKVLFFKTILLVFTVQNLYAIYLGEIDALETDDKGEQIPVTKPAWLVQTVLYNILVNQKYADVIQVFNQMILFYSEDGQMFMIKPNTMIDSETQFTLQYFNKSVNDILLNYDQYINERLISYNIGHTVTKDDVQVKAQLSVNFIKIFYSVPGYITYILIYDVLNNRYTSYDTLTFTKMRDKMFIESGELYITEQDDKTYITIPYTEFNEEDNMSDMSFTSHFKKVAINAYIDTGNLNLNNHIRKRFRDLHVTFKNLSASTILFNTETILDDVVSHPFYDTQLEVKEIGGSTYYVTVPKTNQNDLIELIDINQVSDVASSAFRYALDNNLFTGESLLLDFSGYTSSKMLTHRSSILGIGKIFRMKMEFVSKGSYKLQGYGIIYKERRI
jgi:hypothetical protein